MKKVMLGKSLLKIDDQDAHFLSTHKLFVHSRGYVTGYRIGRRSEGYELLHRMIVRPGPGFIVDHADGDKMNNTRRNLRVCTYSQNNANKRLDRTVRGVRKKKNKWNARIKVRGTDKYLGSFESRSEAIQAYNVAAFSAFGDFAVLNV